MEQADLFRSEKVSKILLKLAPPVMLAQLIQALYNIVDSFFVGKYSSSGLTALSIIYPIQLLMIAFGVGTGVGINTIMAARLGKGKVDEADEYAGVGTPLAIMLWFLFALICYIIMPYYAKMSTNSVDVINDVVSYGRIVCVFSFGLFLESVWTKILQSNGDMKTPMFAQILGAITNIILDPLLIFGMFNLPEMGIAGAAIATVVGQIVAALVVFKKGFRKSPKLELYAHHIKEIFRLGIPNILMQSAYTFYILGLNLILATFCDEAVTALGLYYKWQTFFFIPLGAMQTCVVPIVSYNYATRDIDRCKKTLNAAILFGLSLMTVGTLCFVGIPKQLLQVFTSNNKVIEIGVFGFRIIGVSFIPMVTSLTFPVFFQAVGSSLKSSLLTIIRTVVLFVPLGYLFAKLGLNYFWLTFPCTETITTIVGFVFYRQFLSSDYATIEKVNEEVTALKPSKPGVIITIAREHGSSGKQIGKVLAEKLNIPFYYKEMVALAAHESGLDKEFISNVNKNAPAVTRNLYLSSHVVKKAIKAQDEIIRKIVDNGSCVIVGRASDYVLRDYDNVVRIFIKAPFDYRVNRVMEVYKDDLKQAQKNIKKSDKARASYYRHISGKTWGDPSNYDLVIDSSCGVDYSVDLIIDYLNNHKSDVKLGENVDVKQGENVDVKQGENV